jgi:hypothetical protein
MTYRLTDRFFSRLWRRTKRYSEKELRWLARKHGLTLKLKGDTIEIAHPASRHPVAHFQGKEDSVPMTPFGPRTT